MQMEVVHRPLALGREHLQFAKPARKLKRWLNVHAEALGGSGLTKVRGIRNIGSTMSPNDTDGVGEGASPHDEAHPFHLEVHLQGLSMEC
jgi:hypothetical protein